MAFRVSNRTRYILAPIAAAVCAILATAPQPSTAEVDSVPPSHPPRTDLTRGSIETINHEHGSYLRYLPDAPLRATIVIVHSSVSKDKPALSAAETFIRRWMAFAEEHGIALLAPAFDQENFGGHAGPGGGYRGLFGRHVGADAFVNSIVDDTRAALPDLPEKISIYGHSAGGQFISRYVVMHPERVAAAVISAAGTFAFPDPDVAWTNGMKPLRRRIRWSDDEPWKQIEITPDPDGWTNAAQLPITVVVGAKDTGEIKSIPGNPGRSHVERAQAWVQAMRAHARRHGHTPRIRYIKVPDIGHNSAQLTPTCQQAFFP